MFEQILIGIVVSAIMLAPLGLIVWAIESSNR